MKQRFLQEMLKEAAPGVNFTFRVDDNGVVAFAPDKKVVALHAGETVIFGDFESEKWWPTITKWQKRVA